MRMITASQCAERSAFSSRHFTRMAPKLSWARQPASEALKGMKRKTRLKVAELALLKIAELEAGI